MDPQQEAQFIVRSISAAVSILVVALRFISRKLVVGGIRADDWLMFVALICALTFFSLGYAANVWGEGWRHPTDVPSDLFAPLIQVVTMEGLIYHLATSFAKVSMLAFFLHIIPRDTKSRMVTIMLIWFISIYAFVNTAVILLQCVPFAKVWSPQVPGRCIDTQVFFYFSASLNIVTDLIIFILPIKWLLLIRRSNKEKALILGIFGMSTLCCCIGIIRLYSIHIFAGQQQDFPYSAYDISIYSTVEVPIAIFVGSAPALKPLFFRSKNPASSSSDGVYQSSDGPLSDNSTKRLPTVWIDPKNMSLNDYKS